MEKISKVKIIYDLLLDGNPHSTNEIQEKAFGREHLGYANIHARITEIRKKYGVNIINYPDDKIRSLTYYQMIPPEVRFEEMPEFEKYGGGQQKLV